MKKVLSALGSAGVHEGEVFRGSGRHLLLFDRSANSSINVQIRIPAGVGGYASDTWVNLEGGVVAAGTGDGHMFFNMIAGFDHRVRTPNSGFQTEAWIASAGEPGYSYSGGV